ncbi:hypothetical protein MPTK1_1g12510 [Marchantia polymorpha subsp. ruderalis]|uniref:Uncharacterized protein n=2 Tax=Marchantia polymorpha TaxID=3197 RepID=A0AAF6APE2_MARPO|nr:hypothetical protein MARPO_0019s0021 [Marchantia polymorpha]BBM98312.1 hypothetical protein Mp_1g12510 [Marchantia polymorpha subsp. ruderalis]|eukprot:PTQ44578.1 hypothetical protein MARPO_0019s0021 [Marchantia polymorpha]
MSALIEQSSPLLTKKDGQGDERCDSRSSSDTPSSSETMTLSDRSSNGIRNYRKKYSRQDHNHDPISFHRNAEDRIESSDYSSWETDDTEWADSNISDDAFTNRSNYEEANEVGHIISRLSSESSEDTLSSDTWSNDDEEQRGNSLRDIKLRVYHNYLHEDGLKDDLDGSNESKAADSFIYTQPSRDSYPSSDTMSSDTKRSNSKGWQRDVYAERRELDESLSFWEKASTLGSDSLNTETTGARWRQTATDSEVFGHFRSDSSISTNTLSSDTIDTDDQDWHSHKTVENQYMTKLQESEDYWDENDNNEGDMKFSGSRDDRSTTDLEMPNGITLRRHDTLPLAEQSPRSTYRTYMKENSGSDTRDGTNQ